ncbi:MAG: site-specific DNA-methyltransferase [Syntrophobacterales bacterium]|nr:site-specific DNA-methyltransferase [Syntrophobacterales bacterium]
MKYYIDDGFNIFDFKQQSKVADNSISPFYYDIVSKIKLYNLDTFSFFSNIPDNCVDLIFADPPYFLSSGGITCSNGKKQNVNKGEWDKARSINEVHAFNKKWLLESKRILKENGTIWVCGTFHNIFSVGFALQELDFKILNNIVWEKKDPPPNLTRKYFTHTSEHLIWASKTKSSRHIFNYDMLKTMATEEPMRSVWRDIWNLPSVSRSEKIYGKHPTQKPEEVIRRAVVASSNIGDLVFDPFCGSGTTGVVCKKLKRRFVGIDNNIEYLNIAKNRLLAINNKTNVRETQYN